MNTTLRGELLALNRDLIARWEGASMERQEGEGMELAPYDGGLAPYGPQVTAVQVAVRNIDISASQERQSGLSHRSLLRVRDFDFQPIADSMYVPTDDNPTAGEATVYGDPDLLQHYILLSHEHSDETSEPAVTSEEATDNQADITELVRLLDLDGCYNRILYYEPATEPPNVMGTPHGKPYSLSTFTPTRWFVPKEKKNPHIPTELAIKKRVFQNRQLLRVVSRNRHAVERLEPRAGEDPDTYQVVQIDDLNGGAGDDPLIFCCNDDFPPSSFDTIMMSPLIPYRFTPHQEHGLKDSRRRVLDRAQVQSPAIQKNLLTGTPKVVFLQNAENPGQCTKLLFTPVRQGQGPHDTSFARLASSSAEPSEAGFLDFDIAGDIHRFAEQAIFFRSNSRSVTPCKAEPCAVPIDKVIRAPLPPILKRKPV
ncbi:hypothetical protein GMRT_15258 [Giardia muris]|uniref:Uncharacterized protein n=1 Tax=Giardia muris TaxID=5742 RepID=A0A4Z1SQP6_GIAMU|nr:hypothetical protein GMRT_15258 [Giardia muris]|eukprot:TNJ28182.1 hypothetical protein GMRT_15258 [Giardia muris]